MNSLLYKTKRSFINSVKKYRKKPAALIAIVFIIGYGYFLYNALVGMVNDMNSMMFNRYLSFAFMTFIVLMNFTSGLYSVANQKAVLFNTPDVHFIFSAPLSPKLVLLYVYSKNIVISIIIDIIILFLGYQVMHFSFTTLLLLWITNIMLEVCETAIMIIVYGKHGESKISNYIRTFVKAIVAFLIGYLLFQYFVMNIGFDITKLIDDPFIFLLPFIGWGMSLYYVVFIQATLITIIGSFLLVISTLVLVFFALRLSSQGEFYEEASGFAEEYAKMKQRAKKGDTAKLSWKKKKLKKATIEYRGSGAKALLYRQLLEYKKQRFFIFGFKSIMNVMISFVLVYLIYNFPQLLSFGDMVPFAFIGIMTYITFLSSSYATKWSKEIDIIYTFLIPDTAIKKLWYSTVIEHVRAILDGVLLVVPASIAWKFSIGEILGCIGIYIVLETTKLYTQIICQTVLRSSVGKAISAVLQMFIQGLLYAGAFGIITLFMDKVDVSISLLMVVIYGIIVTIVLSILTSGQFDRMESGE
jgi:hypothetical protein